MSDSPERKSLSVYDYSDKSIQHAWIAVLVYLGLRVFGAVVGSLQQPPMVVVFVIDAAFYAVVLGAIAFGIHKKSRIAVVIAIAIIAGTQLFVWLGARSFSGSVVSVIAVGFLLRGATRIFQHHRELKEARA